MKSVLIAVVLIASGFAQEPKSAPPSSGPITQSVPQDAENTRKARSLLDDAIKALGGQAYLNWQDVTQEGRSYSFHRGEGGGTGVTFTRVRKSWDKDRIDYTASHEIDAYLIFGIQVPVANPKTNVTLIYSGEKGYQITNYGVRDMDKKDLEEYLRLRHFTLERVLRNWLNEPGVAVFYDGRTIAAQREADQITVMNSKNEAVILCLDSETHLPLKKSFSWRDPADKQRNTEEEVFDDYRPTQGVMTPHNVTRVFNGEMAAQSFLNSATYNRGVSDSVFDPKQVSAPGKRH
jgi:hypothetical protein